MKLNGDKKSKNKKFVDDILQQRVVLILCQLLEGKIRLMITFTCQDFPHHPFVDIQHVTLDSADEWGKDYDENMWESSNIGYITEH